MKIEVVDMPGGDPDAAAGDDIPAADDPPDRAATGGSPTDLTETPAPPGPGHRSADGTAADRRATDHPPGTSTPGAGRADPGPAGSPALLPDVTADERDLGWGELPEPTDDDRYLREVPPHHGS